VVAWGAANLLATFFTNQLGRPRVPLTIAALSLGINVVLCLLLIPSVGLSGGAIATSVSYTTAIIVELVWFRHETGLGWQTVLLLNAADMREARRFVSTLPMLLSPRRTAAAEADPDDDPDPNGEPLFRRARGDRPP
jgi:Na+-driven multidrug efflux pump